ncbi:DEAD/DEAH box helicase [Ferrimonas sediminicola]|uniref:DEAD/DEAH box helicase n=1 Tax=Ferrimonas sediminicola TaxID=2569538 RepID=A0A4U1BBM6_9GAMM|nr:DEAD/DEAH box helicase [Ferrimonas sediminicola]TKB47991.1 DEAD/DEAH box helicase [Ferrimonas sediminicola]
MTNKPSQAKWGPEQQLELQQLLTIESCSQSSQEVAMTASEPSCHETSLVPRKWCLTGDIKLYDWQKQCIDSWARRQERNGTVKVVTGGGKTLLGLAIAERLQNAREPNLRVVIAVPTIVLLNQWYEELLEKSNLPARSIGRLGGGYKSDFTGDVRILLVVLASARTKLDAIVSSSDVADKLLLIGDECHHLKASQSSRVLTIPRRYSLGLSATPEDDDKSYNESIVGQQLGPIIFEFSLLQALNQGLIPEFSIEHLGLPLTNEEEQQYQRLSRQIRQDRDALPPSTLSGGAFWGWLQRLSQKGGESGPLAARILSNTAKRDELLYGMRSRFEAVHRILERELQINPNAKVIIFHERIEQVNELFLSLKLSGYRVIADHSELPAQLRSTGLELFRKDIAQVIVSAKTLIEGFNVPAVDLGIIVASSSSVRQRVQTLGRVLRKHRTESGEDKTSKMVVLYARKTKDEEVYRKHDWATITGIAQNQYYHWDLANDPVPQPGPPAQPRPKESTIDPKFLQPGDPYPGEYAGLPFSIDTQGNVKNGEGQFLVTAGNLPEVLSKWLSRGGRFKITQEKNMILIWNKESPTQVTYLGQWDSSSQEQSEVTCMDAEQLLKWSENAITGDVYPPNRLSIDMCPWRFSAKRGGVIVRKHADGECYVKTTRNASDPNKGKDAEALITSIKALHGLGIKVTKFELNQLNHVLARGRGQLLFVCHLKHGLEFPDVSLS